MKKLLQAALFISLLPVSSFALDCPQPKQSFWKNWASSEIGKGRAFLLADFDEATLVQIIDDSSWARVLIRVRPIKIWGEVGVGTVMGEDGFVYVDYWAWFDTDPKALVHGPNSVSKWRITSSVVWNISTPAQKLELFGINYPVVSSDSCMMMGTPSSAGFQNELDGIVRAETVSAGDAP